MVPEVYTRQSRDFVSNFLKPTLSRDIRSTNKNPGISYHTCAFIHRQIFFSQQKKNSYRNRIISMLCIYLHSLLHIIYLLSYDI